MFESCLEIRRQFSEYVDLETCGRATRLSVRYHLQNCASCRRELELRQLVDSDLRSLPRPRMSAFADLRLNVALSRARHAHILASLTLKFENAFRPLLLPASGAVLAGLLCLGLTLHCLIVPPAARPEESLATPARIESLIPVEINTGDSGLWMVTHVNSEGRVVDYQVVSGNNSPAVKSQLDRLMYFSVFHPATRSGRPTDAQVVLAIRRITVRASNVSPHEGNVKPVSFFSPSSTPERSRA
ncbi:MAG TPA: hypothetical protein VMT20_11525 [Terriglobia bacterium]|nr:hypothetical protein [Terriglobia bacterium]